MSVLSHRERPDQSGDPTVEGQSDDAASERVALKDENLVYRACSAAYADAIGQSSPEGVIGRSDVDLLPGAVAREQMALDSRVMFTRQADIGSIELGAGVYSRVAMIVRTPVFAPDGTVRGIDLRLLGASAIAPMRSAVTVDYEMLANEGLQGSLIFSGREILFADTRAAQAFGFDASIRLCGPIETGDLFDEAERGRLADAAVRELQQTPANGEGRQPSPVMMLGARTRDGAPVALVGRVTPVQWGTRRATLLSFVDTAQLPSTLREAGSTSGGELAPVVSPASPVSGLGNPSQRTRQLEAMVARYREYARSAADFFWELDAELAFRRVSPDLEGVLGITAGQLNGRSHRQLTEHPSNLTDTVVWRAQLDQLGEHLPFRDVEFLWRVAGDTRVIRYSGIPVYGPDQQFAGYRGVGCDVTAANRQAQATAYHANHDALTGLANRRHFEALVGDALEASSHDRLVHVLCYLDLDNFKPVNDICGHQAGDELLRQLAQLFDGLVRKSDVLARLGGDEFGVFLYNCEAAEALKLANQIRHEVENYRFLWRDSAFQVGASIGLVVVDDRWENVESLFSAADAACYIAKNEGRNRVSVYRQGEGNASNRKVATHWVEEISAALLDQRVHLAAQKIEPLRRERDGLRVEMLMRMEMPDGTMTTPSAFLPSAERYGLSMALDKRVFELTLAWLGNNRTVLDGLRSVSLNLSPASFTDPAFADFVLERVGASPVPAAKICFEMSETATIANLAKASGFMRRLSVVGFRFCIDDFGSGLSSFAWLRKLPVDFLKIEGLLVKEILEDPTALVMVRSISEISKSMGKCTMAGCVESAQLFDALRDAGIDFAQGFHIGEPELIRSSTL